MTQRLLKLFPRARRSWGESYISEFGVSAGLLKVFIQAWYLHLKGDRIMRTVVATASMINVTFGLFVTGLFIFTDNNSWVALAIGLGLIVQGGYTLAYMSGNLGAKRWATRGLLAGQTVAMTVGLGAGVIGVIETLTLGSTGHPEYGPLAAAGLITLQAVSALYFYAIRDGAVGVDPPTTI